MNQVFPDTTHYEASMAGLVAKPTHPIGTIMPKADTRPYPPSDKPIHIPVVPVVPTQVGPMINNPENIKLKPNEASRFNTGKLDWSLVPFEALEDMVRVLEFGRAKYSANNWRNGNGLSWRETATCLIRHTFAWMRGEDKDPESGISHLGHMACNVLFLLYFAKNKEKMNRDDRTT